jgi:hypothetical protein
LTKWPLGRPSFHSRFAFNPLGSLANAARTPAAAKSGPLGETAHAA